MEEIYIIVSRVDDWESEDQVIGFTMTEESAIDTCKQLDKCHEIAVSMSKDMFETFKNLEPAPMEELIVIPKWASGLAATEITLEQREERDMIIKMNKEIIKRNEIRRNTRREQEKQIVIDFIKSKGFNGSLYEYINKHVSDIGYVTPLCKCRYELIKKIG